MDVDNNLWKYTGGNITLLPDKIRENMTNIIWILAEGHHNGKGLAAVPDLIPIKKQIGYYEKQVCMLLPHYYKHLLQEAFGRQPQSAGWF